MVDFLSDELGRGTKYLQKNSKDYKNKIITSLAFVEEAIKADNSLFRHFGYDQNNTFNAPRQDKILKMIPVVIEFLVENKKMIIQLLDNVSELSFIKEINKCKLHIDQIKNKVKNILEILDLSINTPDEYINDLRFYLEI